MLLSIHFYLLVKEISESMFPAELPGWDGHPVHNQHFKTAYLSPSFFAYKTPCKKCIFWRDEGLGETQPYLITLEPFLSHRHHPPSLRFSHQPYSGL